MAPSVTTSDPVFETSMFCDPVEDVTMLPKFIVAGMKSNVCVARMPLPLRVMGGGPLTELVIVSVPARRPDVVGVKDTKSEQASVGCTVVLAQLSEVTAKSPEGVSVVMVTGTLPAFVSVISWAFWLVVPTGCGPKTIPETEGSSSLKTLTPVPVMLTMTEVLRPALESVTVPVSVPVVVGVNITLTEQLPPG